MGPRSQFLMGIEPWSSRGPPVVHVFRTTCPKWCSLGVFGSSFASIFTESGVARFGQKWQRLGKNSPGADEWTPTCEDRVARFGKNFPSAEEGTPTLADNGVAKLGKNFPSAEEWRRQSYKVGTKLSVR